jgi:hypothetical protein
MTTIKLTEKEIAAVLYAFNIMDEQYTEEQDHHYLAMDSLRAKLDK